MAFFEVEFPRQISFKRTGGPTASTFVVAAESGSEQRNRNWAGFRRKYTVSLITAASQNAARQAFVDQLHAFFQLVAVGKLNSFRFYDPLDSNSANEPLATLTSTTFQLQRTLSLAGNNLVRTVTKPVTSSVVDYTGAALANSVIVKVGGTAASPQPTIDHTTGIVTFGSAPGGAVTADLIYHIPVRLDTDDCNLQVEDSDVRGGNPIISWNSLALVEVFPPNY